MSKRTTKRDVILEEARKQIKSARESLDNAEIELDLARSNRNAAHAALDAVERMYEALERSLAPQPRQSAGTAKTGTKAKDEPACQTCGRPEEAHGEGGINSHEFLPPQKPKKKSSTKKRAGLPEGTASRTITGPACGTCGNVEEHPDHDVDHYLSAHPFAPSPPARNAQPPSSTNGAESNSTQNSEAVTVSAQVAAGGSND